MQRVVARGAIFVVAFALLIGSSLLGLSGAGSRAYAQEPALVVFGSVGSGSAPLPTRVRATIGEVACGSAEVTPTGPGTGFFALLIVSSSTKAGCGVDGAAVRLSLQSGEIDPGVGSTQILFRPGATLRLDLSTVSSLSGGAFAGALPLGAGQAYVRWTGPAGTPIEQALRTIPREVESVTFWDVLRQEQRSYVVGDPAAVQTYTMIDTDDIVLLRVK